jgi:hypothetical protein
MATTQNQTKKLEIKNCVAVKVTYDGAFLVCDWLVVSIKPNPQSIHYNHLSPSLPL